MKVNRQRNLYLKRIFSEEPHTYSYDITIGKYSLIDKEGTQIKVNCNGVLKQKFRPNYSGCVDHTTRNRDFKIYPAALHFTPAAKSDRRHQSLMPQKFAGYAQFPYQIQQSPSYLKQQKIVTGTQRPRLKSLPSNLQTKSSERNLVLSSSIHQLESQNKEYFSRAWGSINNTKSLPKQKKKTCYDNKCKHLRDLAMISIKEQLSNSRPIKHHPKTLPNQLLNMSFHTNSLKSEIQQLERYSKIVVSLSKKRQ